MRITTKAVFDMETWALLEWEGFQYSGPVALAGGGPSAIQNQQAQAQANLSNSLAAVGNKQEDYREARQNQTTPFYTNLMDNGPEYTNAALDYSSGTNARAFAPAKAALMRRLGSYTGLPSGYRDQALTDFDEQRAQGFDQNLGAILADRQAAKERGAAGIMGEAQQANPLGYYQGAEQGNSSILGANLRKPGLAGTIGGLVGGGLGAFVG